MRSFASPLFSVSLAGARVVWGKHLRVCQPPRALCAPRSHLHATLSSSPFTPSRTTMLTSPLSATVELREVPDQQGGQGRPPLGLHHLARRDRCRGREAPLTPASRAPRDEREAVNLWGPVVCSYLASSGVGSSSGSVAVKQCQSASCFQHRVFRRILHGPAGLDAKKLRAHRCMDHTLLF